LAQLSQQNTFFCEPYLLSPAKSSLSRKKGKKTMNTQKIEGAIALVTGANRGIGRALTEALLARGASKVYANGCWSPFLGLRRVALWLR
jgi:hypothetical protein